MTESRPERVLVLYGSHSGTSEEVAQQICELLPEKLSDIGVLALGPTSLDEFLEEPRWEPLVIIVVSSFGLGDAPRNAKKFRELCDQWADQKMDEKPLVGLKFALLGLGSSLYRTYQTNPKAIADGLVAAGATLVGERGIADSSAGYKAQQEQIKEWQDTTWGALSKALKYIANETISSDRLHEMNKSTVLV